ncbi:hypothetical protein EVJ27_13855 [Exiguobacterium sp. SH3S2]|nr:hypothetical protein EVJ28_13840 [Exiguobacterium sp. SH3S3]TCI58156.1 hypothetical protein EVJ27_13855 [Exiguobacterium sp. SH3S2]
MLENQLNERIYRELLEIEESYRQLQKRTDYLLRELRQNTETKALFPEKSNFHYPRRINQRYPIEVYASQVTDLLKQRNTMKVRDIQMELELRYRHHISNIYQLMVKIESVNPEIKKVGRGLYTYASAEEVTTEPAHA